jgi:cytoskeleton protein RodZ
MSFPMQEPSLGMAALGIGERLRSAREALGLSLEEIEGATHIRRAYLHALENEAFEALPGPVYAKGFLRSYAAYLGLPPRELLELYPGGPTSLAHHRSPVEVRITPATPVSRVHRVVTGVIVILAAGILALGYIVYGQIRQFMESPSVPPERASPTVRATAPAQAPAPTQAPAPNRSSAVMAAPAQGTPGQRAGPSEHANASPPVAGPAPTATNTSSALHVIATANDRSWVRAAADGTTVFEGFMSAGDKQIWDATRRLTVRVGNASAIDISVNGRPMGRLGGPGDVVERTFPAGEGAGDTH